VPLTILAGSTFCIADDRGDVDEPPAGLFAHDTRFLSRFVLLVNGARPLLLTGKRGDPHMASFFSRNPLVGALEQDELAIVRRRRVSTGIEEQIVVRNLGRRHVELDVQLELAADFADIFAVKRHDFSLGSSIDAAPLPGPAPAGYDGDGRSLRFADTASDLVTAITFSQPGERTESGLSFHLSLAPRAEWELALQIAPGLDAADADAVVGQLPAEARRVEASLSAWRHTVPTLHAGLPTLQRSYDRSIDDLAALRLRAAGNGELIAAGLPWFMTVFGRDTIIASLQTLLLGPDLARTALRELARLQATEDDASIDAEPGKIVHELRSGKGASAFFARYYGTVDATPLFLVLLSEVWRWTGDDALVEELREPALRALAWIDDYGDSDGDGFVEYERRVPHGLENQTWKDSHDSQLFHDGTQARAPIAAAEVQGYVYDAKQRLAELAREVWKDAALATRLDAEATGLQARFDDSFWCERPGGWTYALALDGEKRPVNALTSNVGHLLWSGIVPEERVGAVAGQLFGPTLWSGWGVRTMASDDAGYNPLAYHDGTVWPHDNSLIAWGLARCGRRDEALQITRSLLEAASFFDYQLPEVFAGFSREDAPHPIIYPTASKPQAWAAGTVVLLLRLLLGLEPDVRNRRLVSTAPGLPDWLDTLRLAGIPALGTTWTADVKDGAVHVRED
jgi:glycogen debranching enzyme